MIVLSLCLLLVASAVAQAPGLFRCQANSNVGGCLALKYAPGQVPVDGVQSAFATTAGLIQQGGGSNNKFPFCAVGVARRRRATSGELDSDPSTNQEGQVRAFGAGVTWVYRGIGAVCDRGNTGTDAEVLCALDKTGTSNCVLGAVGAEAANWNPIVASFSPNASIASVSITEQAGVYTQTCYLRANTASTPTQSGVTLGPTNTKCDVTIASVNSTNLWRLSTPAIINAAGITGCTNVRVALQVWVSSAVAASAPVADGANLNSIAADDATKLKFSTQCNCTYLDGTSVTATVTAKIFQANTALSLPNGAAVARQLQRINFLFGCDRTNGGDSANLLQRVFWDPEVTIVEANVPITGSALSVCVSLLVLLMLSVVLF